MVAAEEGVGTSHESSPPASPPPTPPPLLLYLLPLLLSFLRLPFVFFFIFIRFFFPSLPSTSLSSAFPPPARPPPPPPPAVTSWECVRSPKWRGRRICAKKGGRKKGREKEKKGIMFDRVRLCNVKSRVYYVEVEAKKQKKVKKKNTGGRKKGFLPCVSRHKDNNPRALLRQGQ